MKDFVIIADATCDLNESFQKEYDIIVLPSHIVTPNGDFPAKFSWSEEERDAFYADLKKHPNDYATSPANPTEFNIAFEKAIEEGKDILALTISSGISGTFNFAKLAGEQALEKYPDAKINVVDSLRFGPGFGLLVVYASIKRREGLSLDETTTFIEENKARFRQAGWLDDLSFVAKKGRVNAATAFFGTLAGIKPIGEVDKNGLTTVIGKARGAKSAYKALLGYIDETAEDIEDQIVFIAHTCRYKEAVEYKKLIEWRFHPKAVYINDVLPPCGVNIGPGLMAAYYVGKPITEDLEAERAIIKKYLGK